MQLKDKVAVITGGSSGIGLATAARFVEEGAYVYIMGRRQSELDKAKSAIGRNVTTFKGDVANLADLDRLYQIIAADKGVVDIVFANAGFVEQRTVEQITLEHYEKTFNINVRGVMFTVQKALPLMTHGGSIILNSSIVADKGLPAHGTYGATKAALRSLAKTWTVELKDRGIRINTLSPGATDTPIIDGQFASKEQANRAKEGFLQPNAARSPRSPAGAGLCSFVPGLGQQQLHHRYRLAGRRWLRAGLERRCASIT